MPAHAHLTDLATPNDLSRQVSSRKRMHMPSCLLGGQYLGPSSWDSEGMEWQLRMGDRKGGDGSMLARLRPLLLRRLLRRPSDADSPSVVGVLCSTSRGMSSRLGAKPRLAT